MYITVIIYIRRVVLIVPTYIVFISENDLRKGLYELYTSRHCLIFIVFISVHIRKQYIIGAYASTIRRVLTTRKIKLSRPSAVVFEFSAVPAGRHVVCDSYYYFWNEVIVYHRHNVWQLSLWFVHSRFEFGSFRCLWSAESSTDTAGDIRKTTLYVYTILHTAVIAFDKVVPISHRDAFFQDTLPRITLVLSKPKLLAQT